MSTAYTNESCSSFLYGQTVLCLLGIAIGGIRTEIFLNALVQIFSPVSPPCAFIYDKPTGMNPRRTVIIEKGSRFLCCPIRKHEIHFVKSKHLLLYLRIPSKDKRMFGFRNSILLFRKGQEYLHMEHGDFDIQKEFSFRLFCFPL